MTSRLSLLLMLFGLSVMGTASVVQADGELLAFAVGLDHGGCPHYAETEQHQQEGQTRSHRLPPLRIHFHA